MISHFKPEVRVRGVGARYSKGSLVDKVKIVVHMEMFLRVTNNLNCIEGWVLAFPPAPRSCQSTYTVRAIRSRFSVIHVPVDAVRALALELQR